MSGVDTSMASRRLHFRVHRCSSHQPGYSPQNVTVDRPGDQSSRWSSNDNTPPQFLTLKLARPAVVKTITFGKFHSKHVCNLKKFSVVGGMQDENYTDLLNGGLENNNVKETFPLRHTTEGGQLFPVQYISIIPRLSWGPSFNFCIWYLELHGIDDHEVVRKVLFQYNLYAEKETIRMCLKHFRQQKYLAAFDELQKQTGVSLEAPQLSHLYKLLVDQGDFEGSERLLQKSAKDGLFNWYASQQPYIANWLNLSPCSPDLAARLNDSMDTSPPPASPSPPLTTSSLSPVNESHTCVTSSSETFAAEMGENDRIRPGQRGGHQMCIDSVTNTIYLFGGWDGKNDLSDLWSYSIAEDKWTLIFKCSEEFGGPKPRSCHKMVLDSNKRQIYLFGRYLDTKNRTAENTKSDFFIFDINEWRWIKHSDDTSNNGGPALVFDHQMCIDVNKHIIYVFGGRILLPANESDEASPQYSGLYAYFINEDKWKLLLSDASSVEKNIPCILSRAGHSMLFHPRTHILYIFGGHRNKDHQGDFLAVNVEDVNDSLSEDFPTVQAVCPTAPPRRAPPTGFTQRATIDPELNEIYVLSGLSREKDKRISNSLWVFSITHAQWSCIYKNDNQGHKYWSKKQSSEPYPRFAHQLVYDPTNKIHYLFGGNPGKAAQPRLRLDDFWLLKLSRINSSSALWKARLKLRRLRFQELAEAGKAHEALAYLQTHLYQATDHSDPEQERQFQLLATMLFSEKLQDVIFNPPLEAQAFSTGSVQLSPVSDFQEELQEPHFEEGVGNAFNMNTSVSEQRELFAAVLGMESNADPPSTHGNDSIMVEDYARNVDDATVNKSFPDTGVSDEKWNDWEVHYRRCQLFQQLSEYYPHHMVQPKKNLTDYIML